VPAGSGASEHLHSRRDNPLGLETEPALQFLKRRRRAESLHADDAAGGADIPIPAEHRALLDGDTRFDCGRQHLIAIRPRLLLEDVPGWLLGRKR
jgi:hypothetical protein